VFEEGGVFLRGRSVNVTHDRSWLVLITPPLKTTPPREVEVFVIKEVVAVEQTNLVEVLRAEDDGSSTPCKNLGRGIKLALVAFPETSICTKATPDEYRPRVVDHVEDPITDGQVEPSRLLVHFDLERLISATDDARLPPLPT
jgi:hypothetical protein